MPGDGTLWNSGYKALPIKPSLKIVMPWGDFNVRRGPCQGVGIKIPSRRWGMRGLREERKRGLRRGWDDEPVK